MKTLNEPLTPKKAAIYVSIIAGAVLLGWGVWQVYGRLTHRPPSTADVKQSIWRYLKKETGTSRFNTDFASAAISNAMTELAITNKNGKVKKIPRTRRSELGLPETSLTVYFRTNHATTASYREMYLLIGQQLAIADRLLESETLPDKQSALVMASEASTYAKNNAMNLWPNLSLVEGTNKAPFTPDALLNISDMAFKEAGETNHVIRNYEFFISKTTRPQQADTARLRLARLYLETGDDANALATLKAITTAKNARVDQQIAALEQRLKAK